MPPLKPIDPEEWRRLALEQPESAVTRWIAILISVALLAMVLDLVRRGRLREEYTPIWVLVAVGTLVISLWGDGLRFLTWAIGAWTPSSTLFFFGLLFLLLLGLNYAVRLSELTGRVKSLAQEVSLLQAERDADRHRPEDDAGDFSA